MKRSVIGVLAHVDAGKTTLSEAMLYISGSIRTLGRVDHGSAFLDTFALERERGITIFSKQAVLSLPGLSATLLDTPGHVDFSAEMERTLDVLDCAVLVISAPAGVQSHTKTVWRLLRQRRIPAFIFVNKTDLPSPGRSAILETLRRELSGGVADMEDAESAAECSEELLEEYLSSGTLSEASVAKAVEDCQLFPCFFGAALKLDGVEGFLNALEMYAPSSAAKAGFAARVFKISRDEQGTRLTHMRITGGALRVRDSLSGEGWEEKATALRVYSGAKFRAVDEALPGDVVAVAGLTRTAAGTGLGAEAESRAPSLSPVLTYRVILPQGKDPYTALAQLQTLEEEDPQLRVEWSAQNREIRVSLMGKVQLEVLHALLLERFDLDAAFDAGRILYRETIAEAVEGVGHYEPLRHYAEVHLLLEPAERGSGLRFASGCREDELDGNWQNLILTHLAEKRHLGVLTGSPLTDVTITLLSGRAHLKHTEGGDFRQATYRAVRQGLMQAKSILLEPWYEFRLELPAQNLGRAMTDLQRMGARLSPPETDDGFSVLSGKAPVAAVRGYPTEVAAYTRGLGVFTCSPGGYYPCPEQDAVVEAIGYEPEADVENTPDSVFCSHGAGFTVRWSEVQKHMHLPSALAAPEDEPVEQKAARYCEIAATDKELTAIFERTYGPIRRAESAAMRPAKKAAAAKPYKGTPPKAGPEYVLVDGYNIIFAWDELRALAEKSLDSAREKLIGIMRNYQGVCRNRVIVVFDAYKVKGNPGSVERFGDVSVVYTKEAETADMYIEKTTNDLARDHRVRVATSDALEQIIIMGHGCLRVPASAFEKEVREVEKAIRDYLSAQR